MYSDLTNFLTELHSTCCSNPFAAVKPKTKASEHFREGKKKSSADRFFTRSTYAYS